MKKNIFKIFFLTIFLFSIVIAEEENLVEKQCMRIGSKLGSVSVEDCKIIIEKHIERLNRPGRRMYSTGGFVQ